MRERRQIVERWRQKSASVLITLVRLRGSNYRQPGARLALHHDGSYEGSISGGCLEADVIRKASWLVRNGATLETYSTLFEEPGEVPFGLGCGGVIELLLEPVETPECNALMCALESSLSGQKCFIATWLPTGGREMRRAVFNSGAELIFASEGLASPCLVQARAMCLLGKIAGSNGIFFERLEAPQRLVVVGAGNDAKPLVSMATLLGWNVTVIDGRAHLARKENFPEANVKAGDASSPTVQQVDPGDAVVVMTHSYEQDKEFMTALLPRRPKYFGLLGSRRRSSFLIAEVASSLAWPVTECCKLVSTPIGLDIGGEGPEAIALAIVAEIQACCMGKPIGDRRLTEEHVQTFLSSYGSKGYLADACERNTV